MVAAVIIALAISVNSQTSSKTHDGSSIASPKSGGTSVSFQSVNRNRDIISQHDANRLATRKLIPFNVKTLLKVPTVMRHGDFIWNDDGVAKGEVRIWVDLRRQTISAFRNGHEIGTAVIVYGAEDMSSPEGRFPILNKQRHYHSRAYDAPMPASLFITNDGVALHGSPMSSRRASHGCIGLPVKFAEKLFDASKVGDIVEIARSDKVASEPSL